MTTNFGFKKVSFEDKHKLVQDIFSKVAPKYDLMNDLMSLGIHKLWKRKFVNYVDNLNSHIIDVASGTGDIGLNLAYRSKLQSANSHIILYDENKEMLEIAKNKSIDRNLLHNIDFVHGNAENLPFDDNSFDYYTISFGIRNVSQIMLSLKEARRILKKNGKFLCLEFSKIEHETLKKLYEFYSFNIIPKVGEFVTGNGSAYEYLVESIDLFPDQDHFMVMLKDAGFKNVTYENLTFGIAAIHIAS